MAKKYLTSIDLNKNELQNARIQNLATAPASPVVGQTYYDTATNAAYVWNGTAWVSADASKLSGAIPNAALATNPLARANHTGTQTASTISDLATTVQGYRLDQFAAPTAAVSVNNQKITSLATPTAGTDAANKQYVDDKVAGLSWKDEVRLATTTAGTLASSFANGSTIDGQILVTGDRILIKDQATQSENGIYTVNASGAPTRATDADSAGELEGAALFVRQGSTNGGTRWVSSTTGTITIGTTAITFAAFGGGSTYTAGNGLTLATNDFAVGAGTGISVSADAVAIDTTVVVRKFSSTIGDGVASSYTVTHNLNTQDVHVQVREVATNNLIECDVQANAVNTVVIGFAALIATNSYRVTVFG